MKRRRSIEDFEALQSRIITDHDHAVPTIVIPAGTCCQASGANDLIRVAKRELLEKKLTDTVRLRITGCQGFCQMEPSVLVEPSGTFYPKVGMKTMAQIIECVVRDEVLADELFVTPDTEEQIEKQEDIPFFRNQVRTILSKNEKIDPLFIYDYIKNQGYSNLAKVFKMADPDWVINAVKAAGLRGRGGAGFPTGLKWELLANQPNGHGKFLVCNADEGDPGAYMDRSVLEGNPHGVIEGMIIGAYATGATRGVIYVRNEYPLAIKHLIIALRQARELGLLGENILGTGFSFDINLVKGAGAFVCGEETALIRSIEGKMGEPRQRPPFPVQKGIEGKPTAINNVETWANIPIIIEKGANEFAKIGIENNSGTKIFSLVGKVKYTGLVEVPMGTSIRSIVDEIGGGPLENSRIKAVQTGGPSGGCIPASLFDITVGYDSLSKVGSIMGSGGMIVMDNNTCMVDVAKYFMNFLKDESCGKCFTCRKGTQRMHEILDDISQGNATNGSLKLLEELAQVVKDTTMCGLGQTASNPVISTLRHFREEYLAHIQDRRCPARVCRDLITYSINEKCKGCQLCFDACSQDAISGKKKELHFIDQSKCIKCGACKSVCKLDAIDVV
jgi:NADH:ubiquinone oxidoreductase subunit F (NADH-binding)/(2Fe-2S) ferredoxin/NAD-dependent dihydropyrimidine dehydrogenase PreA subunit